MTCCIKHLYTSTRRYCCMKCEYSLLHRIEIARFRLIFDATKCGRAQWGVIRFVPPQSAVATVVSIWNYYLTMRLILLYRCDCVRRRRRRRRWHSAQPLPVSAVDAQATTGTQSVAERESKRTCGYTNRKAHSRPIQFINCIRAYADNQGRSRRYMQCQRYEQINGISVFE